MDATLLPPDAPLPEEVPALQTLLRAALAENAQLRAENQALPAEVARLTTELEQTKAELEKLKSKLDAALKPRFGQRSERQERAKPEPNKPKRKARPHGRNPLPEHLRREEVVHDLTQEQKRCPCC